MNFIRIVDNTGDSYYVNPTSVAYIKETPQHPTSPRTVYKVVLKNNKQILVPNGEDFERIKYILYGE